jgi:hypothetical protein
LTIGELLRALANGGREFFAQHQRRLRHLLEPNRHATVFDFIPYFVAEQLGRPIHRPDHLEKDFLGTLKLILDAPSKESLLTGFRPSGHGPDKVARIRIDRFAQEYRDASDRYVAFMNARRSQTFTTLLPVQWAFFIADFYGFGDDQIQITELADRLSANYEFEMSVNGLMRNENFSLEKNKSDHIDGQQLIYLLDPEVVFITNDSDFRNRTRNSPQSSRIKSFADLLDCAKMKCPLSGL